MDSAEAPYSPIRIAWSPGSTTMSSGFENPHIGRALPFGTQSTMGSATGAREPSSMIVSTAKESDSRTMYLLSFAPIGCSGW